ncbi:MAG: threonylcarbamoyl-AMP synthase [Candidatus Riflebacteria bacterium]|mgnify:CR=1 FL=1|nr:threonylcarbamoyl-AMP synthase [Candidatus Riflebacteria bacterium]
MIQRISISELTSSTDKIEKFDLLMKNGRIAIIPTDTVYGFAASLARPDACENIFKIKGRSHQKPLILFVSDFSDLEKLGFLLDDETSRLIKKYWPGPLTAVLKKPDNRFFSEFPYTTIGVRMPAHKHLLRLLQGVDSYLLTTSANRSGADLIQTPDELAEEFSTEADLLVEDGRLGDLSPSTVADFTQSPPKILRIGPITCL